MLSVTLAYIVFVGVMATYTLGGPKVILAKILPKK
jgi:hypothetical protein